MLKVRKKVWSNVLEHLGQNAQLMSDIGHADCLSKKQLSACHVSGWENSA